MAVTLMVDNSSARTCAFPSEDLPSYPSTSGKSYYNFYQLKLRQLVTETRHREEYEAKTGKSKSTKSHLLKKRSCKDYLNHVREKAQSSSTSKSDEQGQRSNSVLSVIHRRTRDSVTFTITSNPIPATTFITECKPKATTKSKRTPLLSKRSRITSAPTDRNRMINKKPMKTNATVELDPIDTSDDDDPLPVCNSYDYTDVTSSSSSQIDMEDNHQNARQTILHTLMLHLNLNPPVETSKWDVYRDVGDKFSASISSTVYRNFERIML